MKKISLASSILLALSMQAFADPGKEGDKWIGVFGELYSTDKEKSGFPDYMNDATGFGAEAGFRFEPQWAARLEYSHMDINAKAPGNDLTGKRYGADLMYFLPNDMLYVFGGARHFKTSGSDNVFNFGLGKHWALNDKVKLLTEVASYNDFSDGYSDLGLKVGLAYTFGESTPPAPKDSDRDGVYDPADLCADTPVGTQVDGTGCDIDSDKDGVLNTLDLCPNTPAGTQVDSNGCNIDLDGDGVQNSIDACPDTPKGTPVGAKGCSLIADTDEDGILDTNDQCANTPITDKVDEVGCSIFMEKEVSLNLTVHFDNNSSVIKKAEVQEIEDFVDFMRRYPNTDTVIEGHSSAPGKAEYNLALSQKRADAVRRLLIAKYNIEAERITAVGFGETQLLDASDSLEADAKNRRITAKVSASKRVKVLKN